MKDIVVRSSRVRVSDRQITGAKCYAESNVTELVDAWFIKNQVWALKFKSSAWAYLKRKSTKYNSRYIKKVFGPKSKVSFSHTCGCSCGCSPGYNIKDPKDDFVNNDVWVNIVAPDKDIKELEKVIEVADHMLALEKTAHPNMLVDD